MQTQLSAAFAGTPQGREADGILRACVHCGFCNATCPTYQLLGDELDGPRGRIYLIKQLLEGAEVGRHTQRHLDRCLSCRSCETTCPSGVRYGRLADIGRGLVEQRVRRPLPQRLVRALLRGLLPYPARLAPLLRSAQALRPLLPPALRRRVPRRPAPPPWPERFRERTMLVLDGCVQPLLAPGINHSTARVLDRLGIRLVAVGGAGCCGALSFHLGAGEAARAFARRNIDAWWPRLEAGAEAVVMTASGCGVHVKDYAWLLQGDPAYARKAEQISRRVRDLSEVVAELPLEEIAGSPGGLQVAFHSPCTLQHGQRITGAVERILSRCGYKLVPVADAHLCCGSAGTYSLLQPRLSHRLRDDKLAALEAGGPDVIATANIGCLHHLQSAARVPVRHWIELLDR